MPSDPKYSIKTSTLTGIANAIRTKTGASSLIDAENMAAAIAAIPSGGGGGNAESGTIVGSGNHNLTIPVSKQYSHVAVLPPAIVGNSAGNVTYTTVAALLGDTNHGLELRQGSSSLSIFITSVAPTFSSSQISITAVHDFDSSTTYTWCAW